MNRLQKSVSRNRKEQAPEIFPVTVTQQLDILTKAAEERERKLLLDVSTTRRTRQIEEDQPETVTER